MNLATTATVYLLEQNTDITDTVRSLCTEKELALQTFQSVSDMLVAMASAQPACMIAANDQPAGQALDLLEKLGNKKTKVPVIILGHHSDVASAVAAIKGGAIDYIEKPQVYGRLTEHFDQLAKRSVSLHGSGSTTKQVSSPA
ncbi:response regulator [Endozoicomonas sp.]|nr:response regulator [Endozoicomonas sp.]